MKNLILFLLALAAPGLSRAGTVILDFGWSGDMSVVHNGTGTVTFAHTASQGVGAGTVFVNDTFTGVNGSSMAAGGHVGELGATWVQHSSYTTTYIIDTNRAVTATSVSSAMSYASGTPPSADYDVNANVRALSASYAVGSGPVCRASDNPVNTMIFTRYNASGYQVFQNTAGTSLQIGVSSATAISTGVDYPWKLSCVGTAVTLAVNGVTVVSGTTTVTQAGKVGIRGNSAATTTGTVISDISATAR